MGQLQHPHQELAESRAAILTGQVVALRVSDQAVIHQRQLIANRFEALPHRHLLLSFEPLKGAGFDGCDQGVESFIQGVEGRIHSGAGGVPEFHASIVFECPFDDKLFCQQYKGKLTSLPPKPSTRQDPLFTPIPPPCSLALFKSVPPAGGVKAGRRPPAGLGPPLRYFRPLST